MVLGGCGLKLANWPVFGVAVLVVESVLLLLYAFVAGYSGDFGRGSKADDLCRTGSEANCTAIGACIYDDVLEVCRTAEAGEQARQRQMEVRKRKREREREKKKIPHR